MRNDPTQHMIPHSKPTITGVDMESVNNQLKSNMLAKGSKVIEFEQQLATTNNVKYSTCVSSGSAALQLILLAMNLPKRSEVILPAYVCKSVLNAIIACELTPVLCDIGNNWIMTYDHIKQKISESTSAIILVHTFGIEAWDDRLLDFKIPIVEDLCQAYGIHMYTGRSLKGMAGFCSFNATKYLTTGEGGAVITNDKVIYERAKELSSSQRIATVFSDYQAALGISQLKQVSDFTKQRKKIAEKYLDGILKKDLVQSFKKISDRTVFFRFLLKGDIDVQKLITMADKEGIALRRGVDEVLCAPEQANDFPGTRSTYNSTISLPIYPSLTREEQDRTINFINTHA